MKKSILLFILGLNLNAFSQVTVNSLEDLLPYLQQDNVDVKLAPGTYTIGFSEVQFGVFKGKNPLLVFEGSNSTYDFTDVTINFNTYIFQAFGSVDVNEIQILGNNNVLKNLTMADIGDLAPTKRAQAIVMDGRDNRIEGFHVSIRGSYPYGYGDAFGKGGTHTIAHRKHSGILIRGLRNHLKNTTLISRSYGHCVFMQAASYPIIEGCYIEGEVRTTDDMLAETSGPAFDIDFMTVWGYRLPPGYMMSLQEAGIRAYNAGTTYIDGVEIQRATDNPTVLNCTMKNTRTGVTLAHAKGKKYVEGCKAIGCENGFSIASGIVVDCAADAIYGPVYGNSYTTDGGYMADITILPPSAPYYNGHNAIAYVGGNSHDLTFRSDIPLNEIPSNLKIMVAGEYLGPRARTHTATNMSIRNLTNFPLVLDSSASNILVKECDTDDVVDNGVNNTIQTIDCNSPNLALTGAAIQSSTDHSGRGNRAIDGDTNGNYGGNSVTHTDQAETEAWWQVSLTSEKAIGDIVVFNRTGSNYGDRLSDFSVSVFNANGEETFSQSFTNDAPNPSKTINAGGVMGKTVKITQLDSTDPLSLAEVQVFESSLSAKNNVTEVIKLFPNPVVGEVHVSIGRSNLNVNGAKIELYALTGKKMFEMNLENQLEIDLDLSRFKTGVYLLTISDKVRSVTKKVIKL